jgi:hypothetical protein
MERRQRAWRKKLHPAFFDLAKLWKSFTTRKMAIERAYQRALRELGPTPAREPLRKLSFHLEKAMNILAQKLDAKLVGVNARYPSLSTGPLAYPWLQYARTGPINAETDSVGLIEWIHFERHKEPLNKTLDQAKKGDLSAFQRVKRTEEDAFRIAHGKRLKKFKSDPYHRDLLQLGLCFGMEKLTSEELADCFEQYCTCGKFHDADALKHQRARLVRDFLKASQEGPRSSSP